MFLVDCGLAFPDADLPGVDLVIPDFSYVEHNADKIKGIIITHGHEDHIGGLAYLLKKVNIPIYATKLTIGLIKGKLEEHRLLNSAKLVEIKPRDNITLGSFNIEMIHVNHSRVYWHFCQIQLMPKGRDIHRVKNLSVKVLKTYLEKQIKKE